MAHLDLYSTSQTSPKISHQRCFYSAPLVAYVFRGNAVIKQACCNHWDCPACGQTRARQEYHRMVWGAQVLADEGHKLYFYTFTCRGRELSLEDAEGNYYEWTNRLLTAMRTKCKREGQFWAYAQATERQKRQHPHSHILCTYLAPDAIATHDSSGHCALLSRWFVKAHTRAGLGTQSRVSAVESIDAASRYIAKYLFKDSALTRWPPHWKRVRYSQKWPRPPYADAEIAITLLKREDWNDAAKAPVTWICDTDEIFEIAWHRIPNIVRRLSDVDF